jgi:integrase
VGSVRKTPSGSYELTIRNKKLLGARRVYLTFENEQAAKDYGVQVNKLLKAGIVPPGLLDEKAEPGERMSIILQGRINSGDAAPTEIDTLILLRDELGALRLPDLTYKWAEAWVRSMKLEKNYAPGTIRKRIGALSRTLDAYLRKHPDLQIGNPLNLLPRGAAAYNAKDAADVRKLGKEAKVDVERERRFSPGEFEKIIRALAGEKRVDRERPLELKEADALRMLFLAIYYSGVRLREAYTILPEQIDMRRRVLKIRTSKQWYGRVKMRTVPMRPQLHAAFTHYLSLNEFGPDDPIYPWWNGTWDKKHLDYVTTKLSAQYSRIFDYAGCADLTEHDLRHEATCQWYELRAGDGQWLYREQEIPRIMGWAPNSKMPARYASFRAEDLAQRMYVTEPKAAPVASGRARGKASSPPS